MMTNPPPKPSVLERAKAGALHLLLSLFVLAGSLYLVFGLWYPSPLHIAMGVGHVFLLLLGVDLLLGPLLTTIVFKHDRAHFLKDLTVILLIQVCALFYGLYTVAQGRPVWLAFVVNDVEIVRAIDLHHTSLPVSERFQPDLWSGPKWVASVYSTNPERRLEQMQDEMFAGISLARRPETYQPLEDRQQQIVNQQRELSELRQFNPRQNIDRALERFPQVTGWLPVKGTQKDMVALLEEGTPVAIVDLRPWQPSQPAGNLNKLP